MKTLKDGETSLKNYSADDRVVSAHELSLSLKERGNEIINVKSNIPSLDNYCQGFRNGELITISGRTKNGKTLLAQTLSKNFTAQNYSPLWFTYEVPARQFLSQFDAIPFLYMPAKLKAHSMDWIENRIMESFLKYNTRIIFIDHLHYLFDIGRSRNPSLDIGAVIRRLKIIAVENEFVIFLLAHTSKGKSDADDSYESIRDSSLISQESDAVIMVKRVPDIGETCARARLEFHRRTGFLEKVCYLQKQGNYLVERLPLGNEIDKGGK